VNGNRQRVSYASRPQGFDVNDMTTIHMVRATEIAQWPTSPEDSPVLELDVRELVDGRSWLDLATRHRLPRWCSGGAERCEPENYLPRTRDGIS
jgi:hypothetical protein